MNAARIDISIALERLAELIANRLAVKEGDVVRAIGCRELADQGFVPLLQDAVENSKGTFFFDQLVEKNPRSLKELMGQTMVDIEVINVLENPDFVSRWMHLLYPTKALVSYVSQTMKMSEIKARDFVCSLLLIDTEDPIAKYREIEAYQQSLVDILNDAKELRIVGKITNISMSIGGRKTVNEAGWDLPGGEVLTSAIEDSVNGPYLSHAPDALLLFKRGVIVESKFFGNDKTFQEALNTDEGARRVGEVAFGGNPFITKLLNGKFCGAITIVNEKRIGTFHFGIGNGYLKTGSKNVSRIHLDLILDLGKDNAKVLVDGKRLVFSPKEFYLKR